MCLERLVGLGGCDTSNEPYKLQQVGISRERLEELIDSSYANVDEWFVDMRSFAIERLTADILSNIPQSMQSATLLESGVLGENRNNKQLIQGTASTSGVVLDLYDKREYVKVSINSLSLYTNHTGDVDVSIYNILNGEVLTTVTVACEAGKVSSIPVNYEIPAFNKNLMVGVMYDNTGIDSYKTTIVNGGGCCGRGDYRATGLCNVYSAALESPYLKENIVRKNDSAGLTVDYSILCDNSAFLCGLGNVLGLALLYKVAYEMFTYSINGAGQFSNQQTTNYENNVEQMTSFEFNYGQELEKALKSIKYPVGKCFSCSPSVRVRNTLPG